MRDLTLSVKAWIHFEVSDVTFCLSCCSQLNADCLAAVCIMSNPFHRFQCHAALFLHHYFSRTDFQDREQNEVVDISQNCQVNSRSLAHNFDVLTRSSSVNLSSTGKLSSCSTKSQKQSIMTRPVFQDQQETAVNQARVTAKRLCGSSASAHFCNSSVTKPLLRVKRQKMYSQLITERVSVQ